MGIIYFWIFVLFNKLCTIALYFSKVLYESVMSREVFLLSSAPECLAEEANIFSVLIYNPGFVTEAWGTTKARASANGRIKKPGVQRPATWMRVGDFFPELFEMC